MHTTKQFFFDAPNEFRSEKNMLKIHFAFEVDKSPKLYLKAYAPPNGRCTHSPAKPAPNCRNPSQTLGLEIKRAK
jgi:hypothetical protein